LGAGKRRQVRPGRPNLLNARESQAQQCALNSTTVFGSEHVGSARKKSPGFPGEIPEIRAQALLVHLLQTEDGG